MPCCLCPRRLFAGLAALALAVLLPGAVRSAGQPPTPVTQETPRETPPPISLTGGWLKPLTWRSIGAANMGGRIVALAVYEADPSTYWVATASGGLLKTSNNGVTFEHQFDREATVSVGDVAVAPSDPKVVWVGT